VENPEQIAHETTSFILYASQFEEIDTIISVLTK
jgi:hypothetical protein